MDLKDQIFFKGSITLSNVELIALLLDLSSVESLNDLQDFTENYTNDLTHLNSDVLKLSKTYKLPLENCYKLSAIIELIKRYVKTSQDDYIQSLTDAYEYCKNLQYLKKEYLKIIYLNPSHKIVFEQLITSGDFKTSSTNLINILKPAIQYAAYAILIAHNHPSGNACPSNKDIVSTKKILKASRILGIKLLDHLIIGHNCFSSLKKLKIIKN